MKRWMYVCATAIVCLTAARASATCPPDPSQPCLPQKTVDTTFPAMTGVEHRVHAGDDLQAVINAANAGDVITIDAGVTFEKDHSSFNLPPKSGTDWIVIQTANLSALPAGKRVSPSDAANMPRLQVIGTDVNTIQTDDFGSAAHYRLVGLEVTLNSSSAITGGSHALIRLGARGDETSNAQLPDHIIIDRCYVHGQPSQAVRNGIQLNGEYVGVIDSYISDVHVVGDESHGIGSIAGDGPYLIKNNYVEGAGENIIFGGYDTANASMNPADITVVQNTMSKKLCWRDPPPASPNPTYQLNYQGDGSCGVHWGIKNIFELKNAQRVLVDGNIIENVWRALQSGDALELTPRNQSGTAPWVVMQDVTIQYNLIRHMGRGVSLAADDSNYSMNAPAQRIKIVNNLFYDIDTLWGGLESWCGPGTTDSCTAQGWAVFLNSGSFTADGPEYATFDHNTLMNPPQTADNGMYLSVAQRTAQNIPNFIFTNNIVAHNQYGVKGDNTGQDDDVLTRSWWGSTLIFQRNLIVGSNGGSDWSGGYPTHGADQLFKTSFTSPNVFQNMTTDDLTADYHVVDSLYVNAGTDGRTLGADIDTLQQHLLGNGGGGGTSGGFTSQDIGTVGVSGSSTLSGSTWTLKGAGADIWGTADAFQFNYQQIIGDGAIVARVTGIQAANSFAKAGVMIRASLDASAAHVVLDLRSTNDIEFMSRPSAGANTTFIAGANQAPPVWLKLERAGSTFTASISTDGANWTPVGSTTASIATTAYWGLVVTSHDTTQLNTSTFDNVSISHGGFTSQDVGAVGLNGSSTLSGSTWTVKGAGADIWGAADAFQFNYQQITGDGTIVARVASIQNTNAFAKAGIMIRESLNADAAHAILDLRPTADIEFMTRPSAGSQTSFIAGGTQAPPAWLKLQRAGSTITASISADGTSWTTVGTTTLSIAAQAYWGLVVTNHDTTQLNTSTFDSVSITPAGGLPHFDVPFSVPGTFQAEDFNDGGEGVAYHDNVAGNAGGQYRTSEDVDIIAATGNANGYVVNNFETGEWLNYTISASSTGTYNVSLNVSSEFTGTEFHLEIDGVNVSGSVVVPTTGSWSTFQPVTVSGVNLTAGTHVLKVVSDLQYFNFDSVTISQ